MLETSEEMDWASNHAPQSESNSPTCQNNNEHFRAGTDLSYVTVSSTIDNVLMFDEFERLKSFPLSRKYRHSKSDLAKNGYYFSHLDEVDHTTIICKCAFCSVIVNTSEIETSDEPRGLDARHLSVCMLALEESTVHEVSGNKVIGDITDYKIERNRLISFIKTIWTAPVDPYDLAKWGFYYLGTADAARCVFCHLQISGWNAGDTGRGEHMAWNGQCAFMQQRSVGNIRMGDEQLAQPITFPGVVSGTALHNVMLMERQDRISRKQFHRIPQNAAIKYPQMESLAARVGSYSTWPKALAQKPQVLSEAGFFYIGVGDRVMCFYCGIGLKDWGPTDDPWTEHAVFSSSCLFLLFKKGLEYIAKVQQLKRDQLEKKTNRVGEPSPSYPGINSVHTVTSTTTATAATAATAATVATAATATARAATATIVATAATATATVTALATSEAISTTAEVSEKIKVIQTVKQDTTENEKIKKGYSKLGTYEKDEQHRLCKVCFLKEICIVMLPCGHLITCVDCTLKVACCPICRVQLKAYVRAYLP